MNARDFILTDADPQVKSAYTTLVNLALEVVSNSDGQRIAEYVSQAADGLVDSMRGDTNGIARAARFMGLAEGLCECRADDVLESAFSQYTRYITYARTLRDTSYTII
jgi:hypothetical protein